MDDSCTDLEHELKALRPARPSSALSARIAQGLSAPEARPVAPRYTSATNLASWKWVGWRAATWGATAAACVLAAVWGWRQTSEHGAAPFAPPALAAPSPAAAPEPRAPFAVRSPARLQPVAAANVLYAVEDEGLVLLPDETPARRVRTRYVDTYTWRNPATNASLKWSVPRDEVRVLPTVFH